MSLEFFAPRAARELEYAAAQIAENNPSAAEAFLRAALTAATRIAARPGLGSGRPNLPSCYRFWPLRRYSYLLVYDATTEPVLILRVVHMRRDLPKLLSDPPPCRAPELATSANECWWASDEKRSNPQARRRDVSPGMAALEQM